MLGHKLITNQTGPDGQLVQKVLTTIKRYDVLVYILFVVELFMWRNTFVLSFVVYVCTCRFSSTRV